MKQREIKFRQPIRDKSSRFLEWHYWGRIDGQWVEAAIHSIGIDTRNESQQYTGLKDKNRQGIYEGDVCIYIASNMSDMLIKFEDGCFVGEGLFNTHTLNTYLTALDFESIEIIGNIYQNPELL